MFTSARVSYWAVRLGLAALFLWFGIDKLIHPNYWLNAGVSEAVLAFLASFKISGGQFVYFLGFFEMLVAVSILINFLSRTFAFLAVIFLGIVIVTGGVNEITVRDWGTMGSLIAIIFWPARTRRF